MNLHMVVGPVISAVNRSLRVSVKVSAGSRRNADGTRSPVYDVPGAFMGSIAGNVLTVETVGSGRLAPGQTLSDETGGILTGTQIAAFGTGSGGAGTYTVTTPQAVPLELIRTSLFIIAQVQPLSNRDLQQLDGLNLGGQKLAIYTNGAVNAVVRYLLKGGDLVTLPDGTTWLIVQQIEDFDRTAGWSKAAMTLQNS